MADWKHELSREQYELMIEALLRANAIATFMQESAGHLNASSIEELAKAMGERVLECLALGRFDEEDIMDIHAAVLKDMYRGPDA